MSSTTPVTAPCKHCGNGVVIVEVSTTGTGGSKPSSHCPKCGKSSFYSFNLNAGKLIKLY